MEVCDSWELVWVLAHHLLHLQKAGSGVQVVEQAVLVFFGQLEVAVAGSDLAVVEVDLS